MIPSPDPECASGVLNLSANHRYATEQEGTLESAHGKADDFNILTILEAPQDKVSIFLRFPAWWEIEECLLRELQAPIIRFDMYEDDYWQYYLHANRDVIDSFNPIPLFYQETSETERIPSIGNPSILCQHWPEVTPDELINYYILWDGASSWNDSRDERQKAYPHDTYPRENAWQVSDFMKQLGLPFPLDESGKLFGDAYSIPIRVVNKLLRPPHQKAEFAEKADGRFTNHVGSLYYFNIPRK